MADLFTANQTLSTHYTPDPGEETGLKRRKRRAVYAKPVGGAVEHQPIVIDVQHLAWQLRAACRGMDRELFFSTETSLDTVRPVCESCPVRTTCEDYANEHKMVGFWGAKTDDERRRDRNRERAQARRAARS